MTVRAAVDGQTSTYLLLARAPFDRPSFVVTRGGWQGAQSGVASLPADQKRFARAFPPNRLRCPCRKVSADVLLMQSAKNWEGPYAGTAEATQLNQAARAPIPVFRRAAPIALQRCPQPGSFAGLDRSIADVSQAAPL